MKQRKGKPIAVLGCGPAGLLAAHAATTAGHEVQIFSVAKQSPIGGAQFLHREIPDLTDPRPDAFILHSVQGDAYTYQKKAYGTGAQPDFVSYSHVSDGFMQPAWNMRKAYDWLWSAYESRITDIRVTYSWVEQHVHQFGLVVVAVPKPAVCILRDGRVGVATERAAVMHTFQDQVIQILNRCLPTGQDNTIYYDGTPNMSWYRASTIFGTGSTEWGSHVSIPFPEHEVVKVRKPVATNCDCWAGNAKVLHVGRFGKWKKGELIHHAYENVAERLA